MPRQLTRARVLIVEEVKDIQELLTLLLSARGCTVECARGGAEALPLLLTRDYDLVLCDLRLPGMDGRTLYQQVREERPEMAERFLICTGNNISPETQEFLHSNHLPVLLKPFRSEELFRAVLPFFRRLAPGPG